jgi:MFS family permease
MTGVLLLCNIAVHNVAGLIVTTSFFGLFSSMFVATPVLLLVTKTKDKRKLGTRMGMSFAMIGFGVLSGGPGSGGVLQRNPERLDWKGTWAYGGSFTVAAGLVFCVLRLWLGGWKLRVKV